MVSLAPARRSSGILPADSQLSTLALAVEHQTIRICLLEPVAAEQRLVAWIKVQRDTYMALSGQIATACDRLGTRLGRPLWNDDAYRPAVRTSQAPHLPRLDLLTAAVDPRPPLRVWLAGLSDHVSIAAARRAVSATPSQIVGETVLNNRISASALAVDLTRAGADLLVLCGGYDDEPQEAQKTVLALAKIVGLALMQVAPQREPLLIYAGNRWAAQEIEPLLRAGNEQRRIELVDNVKPTPETTNLSALVRAIQGERWRLVQQAAGIAAVAQWVTEPARLTTLDWSFARMVQIWTEVQGLSELHGVYHGAKWRQHVWARRDHESVRMVYESAETGHPLPGGWPPIQLWSGDPVPGESSPPQLRWLDRSGMAPLVATLGQVSPQAMLQVLQRDLFDVG